MSDELWNRFVLTGKINDYLEYKTNSGVKDEVLKAVSIDDYGDGSDNTGKKSR